MFSIDHLVQPSTSKKFRSTNSVIERVVKTITFYETTNVEENVDEQVEICTEKYGNAEVITTVPTKGKNKNTQVLRVVYSDNNYFKCSAYFYDKYELNTHSFIPVYSGEELYLHLVENKSTANQFMFGGEGLTTRMEGIKFDKFELKIDEDATQVVQSNSEYLKTILGYKKTFKAIEVIAL
ncbi:MAG: hypothetical protein HC917_06380 [Richelia sp. SM2_1_7]|nr:hypothetical protein [Richelia sp. SM2_1_7]